MCLKNRFVNLLIRAFRWIPVLFLICFLIWAYYVYVYHICLNIVSNVLQKFFYLIIFHILLFLFLWSYFQVIFMPIDFIPSAFLLTRELKDNLCNAVDEKEYWSILDCFVKQNKLPILNRGFKGGVRLCIKCSAIKPDRSHHCSICGRCILKFDHHCPWVNTCINFRNYKCFILFLGYGFCLCIFGFFSILPYFKKIWSNNEFSQHGFATFHVLFLFFAAAMFSISLGCLFVYHLYLTARNKSTIETFRSPIFNYGVDANAYNLGIKRNFSEIFGQNKLLWFFPIFTSLGNGVVFLMGTYKNGKHYTHLLNSNEGVNNCSNSNNILIAYNESDDEDNCLFKKETNLVNL